METSRHDLRAAGPGRRGLLTAAGAVLICGLVAGCQHRAGIQERRAEIEESVSFGPAHETAFIDTLQERTFQYFWDLCNPQTGLAPDRAPTRSFASSAATGFALTAYPIGAERGYVTRAAAADRVLTTLRFLWTAPQDTTASGAAGYRGFFYHFLDPDTGTRFADVELSTVDTALLLAGALCCQSYFDRADEDEAQIRALADSLYFRVDWQWAQVRPPTIGHGWTPESGHLPYDWRGYSEGMILYLLALGSPTYPVDPEAWSAWTAGYRWGEFQGEEQLGFGPLFGHQYTHCWIDLRGIRDAYMQERGLDYFENSRRATRSQYAYALDNPGDWRGYGERLWGLTACDGPVHGQFVIDGRTRHFETYWARGASFTDANDDGTVCPSAAASSLPFAPELVLPTLLAMRADHGDLLFGPYGFLDALNPTFDLAVPVQHGRVVPGRGWYDTDYLGIDQGPILLMIENHRSGLVWRCLRGNPHIVRGLRAAGFTGGWLDAAQGDS
ncbi:MAG: glucoamylase family protein [Candidatus Latescibacteria bacterium]|nr:glucoamylase family protein [Candidatus Latescibacterota bacterium]